MNPHYTSIIQLLSLIDVPECGLAWTPYSKLPMSNESKLLYNLT